LKRKFLFFLKSFYFQWLLRIEKTFYCQVVPCPGKKAFASPKKGGGSSFPDAGFRRFGPAIPLPPRLFAEAKKGNLTGFSRPFLSSSPAFLPGQQGNGPKRPTKEEMTQIIKETRIFAGEDG
jgi:hypothetical protein